MRPSQNCRQETVWGFHNRYYGSDSADGKAAGSEFRDPGFKSSRCHAVATHRDSRSWLNEFKNSIQTYVYYNRYIYSQIRLKKRLRPLNEETIKCFIYHLTFIIKKFLNFLEFKNTTFLYHKRWRWGRCQPVEKSCLVDGRRRRLPFSRRQQAALFITP